MSTHMKPTNPKLIYQLRQHAKPLTMAALHPLYAEPERLAQDIATLQRHGLVAVAADAVAWKGS